MCLKGQLKLRYLNELGRIPERSKIGLLFEAEFRTSRIKRASGKRINQVQVLPDETDREGMKITYRCHRNEDVKITKQEKPFIFAYLRRQTTIFSNGLFTIRKIFTSNSKQAPERTQP